MASDATISSSTIPDDPPKRWLRVEQRIRIASLSLMGSIVVAAAAGLLGVSTGTASATAAGFTVEVDHARVTRGGLATIFSVTVTAASGSLPQSVTLRLDSDYMAMFDENGLDPAPVSSYSDQHHMWWTFEVPSGRQQLTVDFDGRIEPSVQWGRSATVAMVDGEEVIVSVDYATVVIP